MGRSDVEYGTDQITISIHCPFDCRYCWRKLPFLQARMARWKPKPLYEAKRYADKQPQDRKIVISFWSEPYCEANAPITREMLRILANSTHTIILLTKNPVLAQKDFSLMKQIEDFWFGSTVTSTSKIADEPYAPANPLRIKALQDSHREGLKTFMSIEPVLPHLVDAIPNIIKTTSDFIDFYIIGRLDYEGHLGYPRIPKGFYLPMLRKIVPLLRSLGFARKRPDTVLRKKKRYFPELKSYHIKEQLAKKP